MTSLTENKVESPLHQEKTEQKQNENKVENVLPESPKEETIEDKNWKAFRENSKKTRIALEESERKSKDKEAEIQALKAAMEAAFNKSNVNQNGNVSSAYGNDDEETEDQRIEKKVQAAIIAREQESERKRQQKEHQEFPQRLQQDYPDFQQVISDENQDYLIYHYPEVANVLKKLPEGYDKWLDIYKTLKKFVPNTINAKKEAAKAEANFNKPKSMSGTSITQPSEAKSSSILSEERKASNWERMQRQLKGVG